MLELVRPRTSQRWLHIAVTWGAFKNTCGPYLYLLIFRSIIQWVFRNSSLSPQSAIHCVALGRLLSLSVPSFLYL